MYNENTKPSLSAGMVCFKSKLVDNYDREDRPLWLPLPLFEDRLCRDLIYFTSLSPSLFLF